MNFELKDYQEVAAAKVLAGLRKGSAEYLADREYTAVSLSAPTAAGKTVIAASVIEQTLFGSPDGAHAPDPEATFLWLTDDPSLNEQTRKKILLASDRISPSQLVTISDAFDEPEFARGVVYFLNIQKLARSSNLVRRMEGKRKFPIWETISNSIKANGDHYYLVIDEAHRGSGVRPRDRQTLAQRLTSGEEGYVPASPVVWGISATPKRFDEAMQVAVPARLVRKVEVPVDQVRESGLIKDFLSVHHQAEQQKMEMTLVREAVRTLKAFDDGWNAYTEQEGEPPVRPALVLQIPPNERKDSIGEILDVCFDEWSDLNADVVAHALESHTAEEFGEHVVKYVAPQDIQDHPAVRLVIFKEALTTGWDCPRAEVMVSLRTAKDDTYIAQLIGRMVRAPLARRIESDESLNRVFLFLPHFNLDAVLQVKRYLEEDPEAPPSEVVINSVAIPRNGDLPSEAFGVVEGLPSYVVPGPIHRSQVGRLHKLGALLVGDELLPDALLQADGFLVGVLESERQRLEGDGSLEALIENAENASVGIVEVAIHADEDDQLATLDLETDIGDIDRVFRSTFRRFRDGLAEAYWASRVTEHGQDTYDAKVLVIALAWDPAVPVRVEAEAEARVKQWLKTFGDAIAGLSADKKAKYGLVRAMARDPEIVTITLPTAITMSNADGLAAHKKHLYANKDGDFKADLKGWEMDVLQVESGRPGFVGWYRNPTGGERALRIPFEKEEGFGKLHPDFVFLHDHGGVIRPSVVDPHGQHLSDVGPKLRGLARYAEQHGDVYARVASVVKLKGAYVFADLTDATVRAALVGANTKDQVEQFFQEHGAPYG